MLKSLLIGCFVALASMGAFSQVYRDLSIQAGTTLNNTLPTEINSTSSTEFKAQLEIVLKPDFYTNGYSITSGSNYFRAYLVPPMAYAELKKKLDATYYVPVDDTLYFKYQEKYVDGKLNYQIYDYQRNPMIPSPKTGALDLDKKVGTNFRAIPLHLISGLITSPEESSYYTLEVKNDKDELWVLRFKYVKP